LRHFGVWCLLLLTAPGIILMSLSRREGLLGLLAAFVCLSAVWVVPTLFGVALTAGLLALVVSRRHALDIADWPPIGRVLGCVWLALYVALTPWPFYLWPWSALRGDIAQALRDEAAGPVVESAHPTFVYVRHPLFRFPIGLHRHPTGANVRYATMYFGDGRFARLDMTDRFSFNDVSD
jgi:hypothetical protein